jgi:hypothetical protein
LLYAVGLGKGAIPTAAAVNWVLKDGLGYLSKILLSKFGRHFDVNPKGWRLFADLLENTAYGLEILTPVFPHLFVPIGAAAGAGRSAAALIQVRTVTSVCHMGYWIISIVMFLSSELYMPLVKPPCFLRIIQSGTSVLHLAIA